MRALLVLALLALAAPAHAQELLDWYTTGSSTPANMCTTDTTQTISGAKTFSATVTSSVAAGQNAYTCTNAGCRYCLNSGCTSRVQDDGFGTVNIVGAISISTAQPFSSVNKFSADGFQAVPQGALGTCNSAAEGTLKRDNTSGGTNTGARTRTCYCTSDGAASPAFAWQNAVSGTVGTATTCPN